MCAQYHSAKVKVSADLHSSSGINSKFVSRESQDTKFQLSATEESTVSRTE
uniref:Uncharacterized protein n=1 Tax=Arion vulgaris TaxID=1028688 RepID=A0A0B7ALH3_9EUPU